MASLVVVVGMLVPERIIAASVVVAAVEVSITLLCVLDVIVEGKVLGIMGSSVSDEVLVINEVMVVGKAPVFVVGSSVRDVSGAVVVSCLLIDGVVVVVVVKSP